MGSDWEYWYPDGSAHAKIAKAHDEKAWETGGWSQDGARFKHLKKLLGWSIAELNAHIPHMTPTERHDWLVHQEALAAGKAHHPNIKTLGDGANNRFNVVENVGKDNYKSVMASMGPEAWDKTVYGQVFESMDNPNLKYRVVGDDPGFFKVRRYDIAGDVENIARVRAGALQAMMSRWRLTPGKAPNMGPHAVDADALGAAWHGEHAVFERAASDPNNDHVPQVFARYSDSDARTKLQELRGNPKASPEAKKAAAKLLTDLDELEQQQLELRKKFAADLEAHKAAKGGKLDINHVAKGVWDFQTKWFKDNKDAVIAASTNKLSFDAKYEYWAAKYGGSPTQAAGTVSDETQYWRASEAKAQLTPGDGPFTKGSDGAHYAMDWNHGVKDLTVEKMVEYAKAYKQLFDKGGYGGHGGGSTEAHQHVRTAIHHITGSETGYIQFPELASSKPSTSYLRSRAILTILSTRRPPIVPIKGALYRNCSMSNEAFAGLHAGRTIELPPSSFANHDSSGWGGAGGSTPVKVVYHIAKPLCAMPTMHISANPGEDEVEVAGTLGITKIERLNDGRMKVHLRHLLPAELSARGLQKGGDADLTGSHLSPREHALIHYDLFLDNLQRLKFLSTKAKSTQPVNKGGFASSDDALLSRTRAEGQGRRLADPTERLAPVDTRPTYAKVLRLLSEWRRVKKGRSLRTRKIEVAIGRGNYPEACRLMELDMLNKGPAKKNDTAWADRVIQSKSGG